MMRENDSRTRWSAARFATASTLLLAICLTGCANGKLRKGHPPADKAPSRSHLQPTPTVPDTAKVLGDYIDLYLRANAQTGSCNIDKAAALCEMQGKARARPCASGTQRARNAAVRLAMARPVG